MEDPEVHRSEPDGRRRGGPGVGDEPPEERQYLADRGHREERDEPASESVCPAGPDPGPAGHRGHGRAAWASSATSVGVLPTFTPARSSASAFACAVPEDPVTIAPA